MSASAATRRIDIAGVLGKAFDTYGRYLSTLVLGALVVFVPVALIAALASGSAIGSLIAGLASLVGSTWYSGMVVRTVQDVQDGRLDSTLGQLFGSVTPVLGQLILVGLVAGIAIAIGLVLLIVPGLILLTMWAVAAPVVVVEQRGVFAALSRSRTLTKGSRWQVLGVIVVIFAIFIVVGIVFGTISAIGSSVVLSFLVQLAMNVLIAPIWALAAAILYFALREAQGEPALPGSMEVFAGGAGGGFIPPAPPESAPPGQGSPPAWSPPDAPAAPPTPEPPAPPTSSPAPAPAPLEVPPSPSAPDEPSTPTPSEAPSTPSPSEAPSTPTPSEESAPDLPPASGTDAFGNPLPPSSAGRRPGGSVPPPGMD